ncbi:MAG: hypothetical protein E7452_05280 [Ruminococcaceae bacterium]|nr:hypothetical protein [Oscillospiraceae bacterium]
MKHIYRNSFLIAITVWLVGVLTAFVCLKVARPSSEEIIVKATAPYSDESRVISTNYGYQWDFFFNAPTPRYLYFDYLAAQRAESVIQKTLAEHASFVPVTDRVIAEYGDTVSLDYIVTANDSVISVRNDISMQIGGEEYDRSFTEQLIGAEIGKTKTFTYTSDELGDVETYTIEATVLTLSQSIQPELTDTFVQSISPYSSVAEFRRALYSEQNPNSEERQVLMGICSKIASWSNCLVNGEELSMLMKELIKLEASFSGVFEKGMPENVAWELANLEIRQRIVLDAVAVEEGFTVSAEEIAAAGSEAEALRAKAAEYLLEKFG